MDTNLNFIGVRKLNKSLLFSTIKNTLASASQEKENLYISILPPVEDLYLIEIADFIPVTRYQDLDLTDFLVALSRNFNQVYYLARNDNVKASKYQKYIKGKIANQYKGKDAIEKGIKFDLIMDVDVFEAHIKKAWQCKYSEEDLIPEVYQFIQDGQLLDSALPLVYKEFYGQ